MSDVKQNTDRELWRDGDNSIHVTAQGGIGINIGGRLIVKSLSAWHGLARMEECDMEDAAMSICKVCDRGMEWVECDACDDGLRVEIDDEGDDVMTKCHHCDGHGGWLECSALPHSNEMIDEYRGRVDQ